MRSNRLAVTLAALSFGCGGRGGEPPEVPPLVKGPDGKDYHLVDKGAYKAYYDRWGRLELLTHDSNGDGRADQVAYHKGAKKPYLIEVDEDFDGKTDRWEDYDTEGRLLKVGTSRRGKGPDVWGYPGPGGLPSRRDYDEDGDGRIDRVETLEGGRVVRVELDADRNDRIDRWQDWRNGRLVAEELDTNGDGRPDRRLSYPGAGQPPKLDVLPR